MAELYRGTIIPGSNWLPTAIFRVVLVEVTRVVVVLVGVMLVGVCALLGGGEDLPTTGEVILPPLAGSELANRTSRATRSGPSAAALIRTVKSSPDQGSGVSVIGLALRIAAVAGSTSIRRTAPSQLPARSQRHPPNRLWYASG